MFASLRVHEWAKRDDLKAVATGVSDHLAEHDQANAFTFMPASHLRVIRNHNL
jgi:hypothetical protein